MGGLDLDAWLARVFDGTRWLQGGPEDYLVAVMFALCFPAARYLLEKTVYQVRQYL